MRRTVHHAAKSKRLPARHRRSGGEELVDAFCGALANAIKTLGALKQQTPAPAGLLSDSGTIDLKLNSEGVYE